LPRRRPGQRGRSANRFPASASAAGALRTVAETIQRTQSLAASVLESSRELNERSREIDAAMDALFQVASAQGGVRKIADLKKTAAPLSFG
jgi:ABC-type transporter Mla subunit MlaD